jgi:hypothetical protein
MKNLKYKISLLFLILSGLLFSQTKPVTETFNVDTTSVVKLEFKNAFLIEVFPSTSEQIKIEASIQFTDWSGNDLNDQFEIEQNQKGNTLTISSTIKDYSFNYLASSQSSKKTRDKLEKMHKGKKFEGLISGTKITIYIPKVKELHIKSQLAKIRIQNPQNSLFVDTDDDIELITPKDLEATYILNSLSGEVITETEGKSENKPLKSYARRAVKNSRSYIKPTRTISLKTIERIILKDQVNIIKEEKKSLKENEKNDE